MRKFRLGNCLPVIIFIFSLLLIPKVNAKPTLELVKNYVSLTHACSYYKLRFEVNGLTEEFRRLVFSTKLSTLKVSKVKQVFGKLNDITLELKINVTYEVQIPDYETVWELRELNITNTTNMTCESIGCLPTEKPNVCNCSFNKLVGYHNETRWKWEWIPILKAFYYRKYLDYTRPDDVKIYSDNLLKHLIELFELFKKSNEIEFRICGNYEFERTPNGWGISIDHIPSFDNQEFKKFTWWNTSWGYRKPINITEQSGNTLTNYQVKLTIDTVTLISEGKMRSDCGDIRFTDENDNEIPYWIENGCNSANTIIWVKVPNIPANGQTTIYMYYGNPDATSESNGDEVFIFWDDFSSDTGKWSIECGTVSWSNGQVILITDAVKDACASIKTSSTFTTDKPIIVYTKALSTNDTNSVSTQPLIIGNTSVSYLVWIHSDTRYSGEKNYSLSVRDITGTFNNYYTDFPVDTKWHEFEFRLKDNHQEEWIDGNKEKEVNKIISLYNDELVLRQKIITREYIKKKAIIQIKELIIFPKIGLILFFKFLFK